MARRKAEMTEFIYWPVVIEKDVEDRMTGSEKASGGLS